jgi:lipoyl synthase
MQQHEISKRLPKPAWIKVRVGSGADYARTGSIVHGRGLHTVCEAALCPNRGECWEQGRATIMILGGVCSRACTFCNVTSAQPEPPDADEPRRVAEAVAAMGLRDVVITSVTRDDLPDGGAAHWAATLRAVRRAAPTVSIEVLIPDFGGSAAALQQVIDAAPAVLGHNVETTPSRYATVRPQADYARSLTVLRRGYAAGQIVKSGMMLGLGETRAEVEQVMRDVRAAGCDIFYAGQYLQPSIRHHPVVRYVPPAEFEELREAGRALGFPVVVSAPLVRSSYHSDDQQRFLNAARERRQEGPRPTPVPAGASLDRSSTAASAAQARGDA